MYRYVLLIRPHLEYASQFWNPYKVGDIGESTKFRIKNVQCHRTAVMMTYCRCSVCHHCTNIDYIWSLAPTGKLPVSTGQERHRHRQSCSMIAPSTRLF